MNDGVVVYPLKFCNTRWLEDVPVAGRAIAVWPKVEKYVEETNKLPRSKQPGCNSYIGVKEFVPDTLVQAKLNFFILIAKVLKPFLEKFQTESPMMPFMADELKIILFTLLSKFIKRYVLDSATTMAQLAKIDVYKDTNLVPAKKVDIGFAASWNVEKVVKEKSASELQVFEF